MANPFPPTDENLIAGGKIYLNECAGCHGEPGKPYKYPGVLFPPVPNLPAKGTEYTEAQVFWVAKHGVRRSGMFANGLWDSDEKLWKAAAFHKKDQVAPTARQCGAGGEALTLTRISALLLDRPSPPGESAPNTPTARRRE